MIGDMRRKDGWDAPFGKGLQNQFANFASISSSDRHTRHYVASNVGLFR